MSGLLIANIQKALYHWVREQTESTIPPEQILWRNQSEPLPPRPCVTLKITDGPRRVGFSDHMTPGSGNKFDTGGQRVMTISVQVFGDKRTHRALAYQLAVDLNSSLSLGSVLDRLRGEAGIAVFKQGEVTNLTGLEETEYEERAQFDMLIGVAQNITDDPGTITTANAVPNITGP